MEAGICRDLFPQVPREETTRQNNYRTEKEYAEQNGLPAPPPPPPPSEAGRRARAFNTDCAGPNAMPKLARYEASMERSIQRNLNLLKMFQEARRTPPVPPQKDNCEANPNNPWNSSEDFVEILHLLEDAGHAPSPTEVLRNPLFVPPNMNLWTPQAGFRFSAPPGASL
jgi:hypothetical protein